MDFREAYSSHNGILIRYIQRRSSVADAENVAGDIWCSILARGSFPENLRSFLFAAARRRLAEIGRRNRLEQRMPFMWRETTKGEQDLVAAENYAADFTQRLLGVCTPQQRRVLVCLFYMDMTPEETAKSLGICAATVNSQMRKIRERAAIKEAVSICPITEILPDLREPTTHWPETASRKDRQKVKERMLRIERGVRTRVSYR